MLNYPLLWYAGQETFYQDIFPKNIYIKWTSAKIRTGMRLESNENDF